MCRKYLEKEVHIVIDQPYGTYYEGTRYELNYGYIPGTIVPDGDGLDAYYLGIEKAVKEVTGYCIAIVHRYEDDDDKLILVKKGVKLTDEQIEEAIKFRERIFLIVLFENNILSNIR